MQLPHLIAEELAAWRASGYSHEHYPAIGEVLDWLSGREAAQPSFLRIPQVRALETYWYLRLVRGTPGAFDLYQSLVTSRVDLRKALGLNSDALREHVEEHGFDALIGSIRSDDAFVKHHKLKPVSGNIEAYDFGDDIKLYVIEVVCDFLKHYGDVSLPNGAMAKLAIYFPQTDDLEAMRPVVEAALAANGHMPSECVANHSLSPQVDVDAFNRLNDPSSSLRVILLVNRGTEGWNCPSLFAA